jgi:hypothetical protein
MTGADLHGAPDLVLAPQRAACDGFPVSAGRMGRGREVGRGLRSGLHAGSIAGAQSINLTQPPFLARFLRAVSETPASLAKALSDMGFCS